MSTAGQTRRPGAFVNLTDSMQGDHISVFLALVGHNRMAKYCA